MTHLNSTDRSADDRPDHDPTSPSTISRRDFSRWLGAAALGASPSLGSADRWMAARPAVDVTHAPDDICFTPAIQLAAMIRAKKVSAREVMQALQIVGRHRDDWSVLQLAHAFERATGHGLRRPLVARG